MSKVSEVRYVGYAVPDLEAERKFYQDKWLLRQVAQEDGMVYFAAEGSDQPYVVRLRQAAVKSVEVISLAAETSAGVDELHAKVKDAGCKIIFAPKPLDGFRGGYGFRFFSADGLPFEISSNVQRGSARELQRWEGSPLAGVGPDGSRRPGPRRRSASARLAGRAAGEADTRDEPQP